MVPARLQSSILALHHSFYSPCLWTFCCWSSCCSHLDSRARVCRWSTLKAEDSWSPFARRMCTIRTRSDFVCLQSRAWLLASTFGVPYDGWPMLYWSHGFAISCAARRLIYLFCFDTRDETCLWTSWPLRDKRLFGRFWDRFEAWGSKSFDKLEETSSPHHQNISLNFILSRQILRRVIFARMSYSAFVQFVQDCKITSLDWQDFRMAFALGKDAMPISVPIRRFRSVHLLRLALSRPSDLVKPYRNCVLNSIEAFGTWCWAAFLDVCKSDELLNVMSEGSEEIAAKTLVRGSPRILLRSFCKQELLSFACQLV